MGNRNIPCQSKYPIILLGTGTNFYCPPCTYLAIHFCTLIPTFFAHYGRDDWPKKQPEFGLELKKNS